MRNSFQLVQFRLDAIITMLPVALMLISEHIDHQIVTGRVIGKGLFKDPGLHRSLMDDGLSTMASGTVGTVPTAAYDENIGTMVMTHVYSVWVVGGAVVLSVIGSLTDKFSELIATIFGPVVGGISSLLYGVIDVSGLHVLVDSRMDSGKSRNIIMTSIIFVMGLSGVSVHLSSAKLKSMVLTCVVGMIMGLIFYVPDHLHLTNDSEDDRAETTAE